MAGVFISHRGADSDLAEKLATELRRAGHHTWLDTWEVEIGDQIIGKMNDGLGKSTYLVLCYSSIGMAPWMNIEWMSALSRQLNGEGVKVLPVRLSGREGPPILSGTKYADLTSNWDLGVASLLKAIK
jgi:TIR domain